MTIPRPSRLQSVILFLFFLTDLLIATFVLFHLSRSRTFQVFGQLVPRVETNEKIVALTFDDGPTEQTSKILEVLKETETAATFYVIGENMEKMPEEGKAIVEAGHELGNHSYTHHRMVLKSPSFVKDEIEKTDQKIREADYEGEITFRPPNGKKLFILPFYLMQNKRITVMWDVEPESYDEVAHSTEKIVEHVLQHTQPGSIILLHGMCNSCEPARNAVKPIITELKNQGYQFVTISELLEQKKSHSK